MRHRDLRIAESMGFKVTFANGSICSGSAIDHSSNHAYHPHSTNPSISVNLCGRQHRIVFPPTALVIGGPICWHCPLHTRMR